MMSSLKLSAKKGNLINQIHETNRHFIATYLRKNLFQNNVKVIAETDILLNDAKLKTRKRKPHNPTITVHLILYSEIKFQDILVISYGNETSQSLITTCYQVGLICSKSTIEASETCVKSVQS